MRQRFTAANEFLFVVVGKLMFKKHNTNVENANNTL